MQPAEAASQFGCITCPPFPAGAEDRNSVVRQIGPLVNRLVLFWHGRKVQPLSSTVESGCGAVPLHARLTYPYDRSVEVSQWYLICQDSAVNLSPAHPPGVQALECKVLKQ